MKKPTVRPSPSQSATQFAVGAEKVGNDAHVWVVAANKNGVHRWVPAERSAKRATEARTGKRRKKKAERPRRRIGGTARKAAARQRGPAGALQWIRAHRSAFRTLFAGPSRTASGSRASLVRALGTLVEGWEALTGRNEDLPPERLETASMRELKTHYDWYHSTEAQAILARTLADLLLARVRT